MNLSLSVYLFQFVQCLPCCWFPFYKTLKCRIGAKSIRQKNSRELLFKIIELLALLISRKAMQIAGKFMANWEIVKPVDTFTVWLYISLTNLNHFTDHPATTNLTAFAAHAGKQQRKRDKLSIGYNTAGSPIIFTPVMGIDFGNGDTFIFGGMHKFWLAQKNADMSRIGRGLKKYEVTGLKILYRIFWRHYLL